MDTNFLLLSVLFGAAGAGFFMYGKKQQRLIPLLAGGALFIYPYFMPNNWMLLGVGVGLCVLPFVIRE